MTMSPGGIILPPDHDARTDSDGYVWIGFVPAELETFVGVLNRGNIVVTEPVAGCPYEGPAYVLKFLPRYFGNGPAAIEISKTLIDRCLGGWVCDLHQWLPLGHDDCEGPRYPCPAPRHERTLETPPSETPNDVSDGGAADAEHLR